jgi:hypothetical protein
MNELAKFGESSLRMLANGSRFPEKREAARAELARRRAAGTLVSQGRYTKKRNRRKR